MPGVRLLDEGSRTVFIIPKTGLSTYDALRAYGAAIALDILAISNKRLSAPTINDRGTLYEVELPEANLDIDQAKTSHQTLALLTSLGQAAPLDEALKLTQFLLLAKSGTIGDEYITLQTTVEPAAVKAPRGSSRLALQRRGEMLSQHKRNVKELSQLAYLAAWGRVTPPAQGERWSPECGIFLSTKIKNGVRRLLALPSPQTTMLHERDATAIADAPLWSGSDLGAACHLLCILALRGASATHSILVDRLRRVQGGQWQPEEWGEIRSSMVQSLASTAAGHAALYAFRRIFDNARTNRRWEGPAHRLADFLVTPSPAGFWEFMREARSALGSLEETPLTERDVLEVVRVMDADLARVYEHPSVLAMGRALRDLINQSEAWHVWEEFSNARGANDLSQAVCDMLREISTTNRRKRKDGGSPVWTPSEDDVKEVIGLATMRAAEQVGRAVATFALAWPSRQSVQLSQHKELQDVVSPGSRSDEMNESGGVDE
jgi:hypothetical protein